MDPRLLRHYNRELQFIREMGAEFAEEYPKIAGRLSLDGFECADPYVERLLEGFAFLAARVQVRLEAEFPRFTRHLLEMVYPHYLAPLPSMAVVQFQPDLSEGGLAKGYRIPRDTVLRGQLGKGDQTPCEYRTAHPVTLWPLKIAEAEYHGSKGALGAAGVANLRGAKAGIRLRLETIAGIPFSDLQLDALPLYLHGSDELPMKVYEQCLGSGIGVVVQEPEGTGDREHFLSDTHIKQLGFSEKEAVLPYTSRSFQGYRLLQEYFAFPKRFMFIELGGLQAALARCNGTSVDITILLDRAENSLDGVLNTDNFALFSTPASNLFPVRADRVHLNERQTELHVVPDRSRPMDFEVYSVDEVTGIGADESEQEFLPFYAAHDRGEHGDRTSHSAFFSVRREPRILSTKQRRSGPRSTYVGNEVFVSLVDAREAPYRSDLRQIALKVTCTNRDLPLHMPVGRGETDFTLESGAPVERTVCLSGPTTPKPSVPEGESHWRLISQLSLNYLSLADHDQEQGAASLRDLLALYADRGDATIRRQIEGVKSISTETLNRRLPIPGPITFGRGLQVTVTLDDGAFEGTGVFLLGAVLEQFFARYVSINSFTETVVRSTERGEIMRWPARIGRRHTL